MLGALFDRFSATMAMVALSPVFIAIATAIKIEDGGPVVFSQERVGFRGRPFRCHKFRTMLVNAEALLMQWKAENHEHWQQYAASNFKLQNDPRVTRVGRILRRTSLDELPQLVNVLCGEMRLVGPRPLLEREVPDYGADCFEKYKQMVPGLTGLWQVSGRSNTTFAERAALDGEYFERRNVVLDFKLLFRTVGVLFRRSGAY